MLTTFLGDLHGCFGEIPQSHNPIIQVGDLGIGFKVPIIGEPNYEDPVSFGEDFYFIRGNHDNPEECQQHKNYLGDYGFNSKLNIFFVGGGFSIDRANRTQGIDWWPDEELSIPNLNAMLLMYEKLKPDIVVTHECPWRICGQDKLVRLMSYQPSRTSQALDVMLEIHWPKRWIFGHHHRHLGAYIHDTHFICLDIAETLTLDI